MNTLSPLDPANAPVEILFPATPRQSYDLLQAMLARAGAHINAMPDADKQAAWYIGYYLQEVFAGFFSIPMGVAWVPPRTMRRLDIEAGISHTKESKRQEFIYAEQGVRGFLEWQEEMIVPTPPLPITREEWEASLEMQARKIATKRVPIWRLSLYHFKPFKASGYMDAVFILQREPVDKPDVLIFRSDAALIAFWEQNGLTWPYEQQQRFAKEWKERSEDESENPG